MSDIDTAQTPADFRAIIERQNREKEEAVAAERDRAAALERELAFARAGVDLSSEAGQFFARGYDGELEAEAIKAAAAQFMPASPSTATTDQATGQQSQQSAAANPEIPAAEAALLGAQSTLNGSHPDEAPPPADPYAVAAGVHERATEEGLPSDDALGLSFNAVVGAAQAGDRRVIVPPKSAQALG